MMHWLFILDSPWPSDRLGLVLLNRRSFYWWWITVLVLNVVFVHVVGWLTAFNDLSASVCHDVFVGGLRSSCQLIIYLVHNVQARWWHRGWKASCRGWSKCYNGVILFQNCIFQSTCIAKCVQGMFCTWTSRWYASDHDYPNIPAIITCLLTILHEWIT